jgi:hypothetical protein
MHLLGWRVFPHSETLLHTACSGLGAPLKGNVCPLKRFPRFFAQVINRYQGVSCIDHLLIGIFTTDQSCCSFAIEHTCQSFPFQQILLAHNDHLKQSNTHDQQLAPFVFH